MPVASSDEMLVKDSSDGCCDYYRAVPKSCVDKTCPDELVPTCNYCEDLVSYKMDECCSTFECKCNLNKCVALDVVSCPIGSERVVVDTESCCPIGKCVRRKRDDRGSFASATSDVSMGSPFFQVGGNNNDFFYPSSTKPTLGVPTASEGGEPTLGFYDKPQDMAPMEIYPDEKSCTDEKGQERSYGETWIEKSNVCKICICQEGGLTR